MKRFTLFFFIALSTGLTGQVPDLDSLKEKADKASGSERFYLLLDLAYYSSFSDPQASVQYAHSCLDLASELKDSALWAEACNGMAISYLAESKYNMALKYNKMAWNIRKVIGTDYQKLSSLSKIGNCYHELGYYDSALVYFLTSVELCDKNNLVQQKALLYNNIAEVEKRLDNYDQAVTYYSYAINTSEKLNDTVGLANAKINLAILYKNQKRYDQALAQFNQAEQLISHTNYLEPRAGLYLNRGVLCKEQGKIDSCIYWYKKAEEIYSKTGELHGYTLLCTNLGNTYLDRGNKEAAGDYYNKAHQLAKKTGSLVLEEKAVAGLSRFNAATGNFRQAYQYQSISRALNDSVFNIEKTRNLEELRAQYESEKKEKQLAEQQLLIAYERARIRKRNGLIAGISSLVLILFGGVLLLRARHKGKQIILEQKLALEKADSQNRIQNEKLRISRELHDNIGSQLSYLVSALDNLNFITDRHIKEKRLQELSGFAQNTINELRETIWALNSKSISLSRFATRVNEFLSKLEQNHSALKTKLEFTGDDHKYSAHEAINIFRTIQEACTNAVKHGNATQISVQLTNDKFTIQDNGSGFSITEQEAGNGLQNMKTRMDDIAFRLEITSLPGKGTSICGQKIRQVPY